ncbi:MAG: transposase, partial [Cloacibacillus sp.]
EEIRGIIYTTHTIESLNMSLRTITRNRRIFPSDESALKIITLEILEASNKWTLHIKNWGQALGYFCLQHPDLRELHLIAA